MQYNELRIELFKKLPCLISELPICVQYAAVIPEDCTLTENEIFYIQYNIFWSKSGNIISNNGVQEEIWQLFLDLLTPIKLSEVMTLKKIVTCYQPVQMGQVCGARDAGSIHVYLSMFVER